MQVTKDMYDEELQAYYRIGRMLSYLVSRNWGSSLVNASLRALKGGKLKDYLSEERHIPSRSTSGHQIRLRIFRPSNQTERLPVLVYFHGGGYMIGSPEQSLPLKILGKRQIHSLRNKKGRFGTFFCGYNISCLNYLYRF